MKRTFRLAEGFHAFREACDGHWNHAVAAENLLDHVNGLGVGPVCLRQWINPNMVGPLVAHAR
jgi:hypothetical protein